MCVWADDLGFEEVFVGEHHAAEDSYVPSPITLLSAVAARTKQIKVHVSALLVTMYNPLRLAEDLAVLDIISNGRLRMTAGMGYRPHEFEMFGVDFKTRLKTYLENIDVLQKAWTGEPFEYQGRTVRVSPRPVQRPGPKIIMGGSTDKAAARAARMGFDFMPGFPPHYELYKAALRELGKPEPAPLPNQAPNFLYVTHDPERDWELLAPAVLHGTNTYAQWATERGTGSTMYQNLESVAQLKANPIFQAVCCICEVAGATRRAAVSAAVRRPGAAGGVAQPEIVRAGSRTGIAPRRPAPHLIPLTRLRLRCVRATAVRRY
jgi:hypothetical protein